MATVRLTHSLFLLDAMASLSFTADLARRCHVLATSNEGVRFQSLNRRRLETESSMMTCRTCSSIVRVHGVSESSKWL